MNESYKVTLHKNTRHIQYNRIQEINKSQNERIKKNTLEEASKEGK